MRYLDMISDERRKVLNVVGEKLLYAGVGHVHDEIGRVACNTHIVKIAFLFVVNVLHEILLSNSKRIARQVTPFEDKSRVDESPLKTRDLFFPHCTIAIDVLECKRKVCRQASLLTMLVTQ
jgi:hypothetical protein